MYSVTASWHPTLGHLYCTNYDAWVQAHLFIVPMSTLNLILMTTKIIFCVVDSDKGMSSWYIGKEQLVLLALPPSSFQMQSKVLHLLSQLIKHFWQAAFLLRLCFPWLCRLLPSQPSNPCAKFILQFSFPSIKHLLSATGTAFSVTALSVELLVFTKCFIHKVVHMFNFRRQIMVQLSNFQHGICAGLAETL